MPELPEVESYRLLAERAVGRPIARVEVRDPHCLAAGTSAVRLDAALTGATIQAARRRGKLLLLDTAPSPTTDHQAHHEADGHDDDQADPHTVTLGMHFGMSGTLVVDGVPGVARLIYSPEALRPQWYRFRLHLADGGELALHDPRRLGRVSVDADEDRLGPDALTVTLAELRQALQTRPPGPPLKARLLDQAHLAGIGNLAGDELLWRAGVAPTRPCTSLSEAELRTLQRAIGTTLRLLIRRGGSHTGDLMPARHPHGHCPKDGVPLARAQVGGRTTFWCPAHQR